MHLAEFLKNTSQAELAARLSVTQSAVSQWLRGRVPAERVIAVEVATDGLVSRHELRPDIFGPSPESQKQAAA